jgi:hypothetical protein
MTNRRSGRVWIAAAGILLLPLAACGGDGEIANQQVQDGYAKEQRRLLDEEAGLLNSGSVDPRQDAGAANIEGANAGMGATGVSAANVGAEADLQGSGGNRQ